MAVGFRSAHRISFARNGGQISFEITKGFLGNCFGNHLLELCLFSLCEDPKQARGALKKHFERDTLAKKMFFKKKKIRTEMKEGTSIEQHLKYMKDVADKLAAIGAPVSEEDEVATLLGCLPGSYATLVTALEARVGDVKMDFVQQALPHEESKPRSKKVPIKNESTTMRMNMACFKCGSADHIRRNCNLAR